MPQPVDVGSVLGGRYKVTAQVLASAEQDLVLEGVDQVLNRTVSILVAAPANASQVATSAREVATGERTGTVQVLDLGVSDGTTYLVTNHAQPADLLDLVISQDAPFVEPFFTETLGSEIFGVPRSTEPETYDDEDEDDYDDEPRRPILPRMHLPRPKRHAEPGPSSGSAASAAAGAAAAGAAGAAVGGSPAGTAAGSAGAAAGAAPSSGPAVPPPPASQPRGAVSHTAAIPAAASAADSASPAAQRAPSSFPLNARQAGDNYSADEDAGYYEDEDEDDKPKRSSRLLVGSVLALLVIAAVVVAVTQLGGLFRTPVAGPTAVGNSSSAAASPEKTTDAPAATSAAPTGGAAPKVAGVTRLVPGNQELDAPNDSKLPQAIDGNPASFWSSYVYASNAFGGLAESMALVVELEDAASVASLRLTQLNGTGGKFSVMLSDKPALDGARQVAEGSFTAPTITVPIRADGDGNGSAKYVIINFTELPRLSNTTGPYPFGLQVAEIQIT